MNFATLINSLRTTRQTEQRTAYQQYLSLVRELASGKEIDAAAAESVLAAAGKTEDDLQADVILQQQRLQWHSQLQQRQQALADRAGAEMELAKAQAALQSAYDKLAPAVDAARLRLAEIDQLQMTTAQVEHHLCGQVLDRDLLDREETLGAALRDVTASLLPLLTDRERIRQHINYGEYRVELLSKRKPTSWPVLSGIGISVSPDDETQQAADYLADQQDQLSQIDVAIRPLEQKQQKLQAELQSVAQLKLQP